MREAKREQATPINILDGVLKGDSSTRYLRPTFYDLLVQRALGFFLSDEPAVTKPKLAFNLNDTRFFADGHTFTALPIKTTDTVSIFYIGLKLLHQASLFHMQKQQDEALADLDIKRQGFLFSKSSLPGKDSLYINSLRQIAATYSTKPISADAWLAIGKYYQQKDSLRQAMQYFNKALNSFPESIGAHNASILIRQLQKRELSTTVEDLNIPGKPILALMSYRNVKSAKYSLFRLSQQQYQDYKNSWSVIARQYSNNDNRDKPVVENWIRNLIKLSKPVQQGQLQLPDPQDYRWHHTEFGISPLRPGPYILYIEDAQLADSTLTCYADFQVSRLAYTARVNPDNSMEVRVLDREKGEALKGVRVKVTARPYNDNVDHTDEGLTDKDGSFISSGVAHYNSSFVLILKTDTLTKADNYLSGAIDRTDEDDDDREVWFTDRQIYRPGQTVYFKGLSLQIQKGRSYIRINKEVDVDFKDPNGKTLSSLKLRSNDFGTFSGSFIIPQSILSGRAEIGTADGNIEITVEEYKRPTFRAEFSPITASYKLNDSVKVKGNVTAFSGYGLSRARVAYHIMRHHAYGYYYHNNSDVKEIASDTIYTDDQGQFVIKYKAGVDVADMDNVIYNYDISADVTDAAGETHSANAAVKVSNNNIVIRAYMPASILANDTAGISAGINNLNGHPLSGKLRVQVYALQNPPHLFKNRLWQQNPDLFMMSKEEYRAKFPYYAYGGEDDFKNWQQLGKLTDSTYILSNNKNSSFYLRALSKRSSGLYKLVLSAQNEQGDTTSLTRYFKLIANPSYPTRMVEWVVAVNNNVKPGGKAEYRVGINEPVNVLMEKYLGLKKVLSRWLHIDKKQKIVMVPIALADSDVNIQFMMVYQNRMYSSYQKVNIIKPDRSLNIKMLTYRDKLQPGDKEQWKLQVSAPGNEKIAAEMVACMYDESLDDISPATNWMGLLNPRQHYHGDYYSWNTYNFIQQDNSRPLVYRNYVYQLQVRQYEELELFGYNYYGGYNGAYHNYYSTIGSKSAVLQRDRELQQAYERNAALVKSGVDVTGKVVDEKGQTLPGVSINIKGMKISTSTNSNGEFKIRVLPKGVVAFNYIGYSSKEFSVTKAENITIVLKEKNTGLSEVVVIGYGTVKKSDLTGSVASVSMRDLNAVPAMEISEALAGRLAGVQITNGAPGGGINIMIRGSNSTASDKAPLYVVDGVVIDGALNDLSPSDIAAIDVLKDAAATAIYGSRGANGVVIITTKGGKARLLGAQPIVIRKNFNETAFFYPQLRTDDKGEILIDFTIPEALTKWKFRGFAHTRDMRTGYMEKEIVTQKQLSISANTPRFLREGDTVTVSARLANLSAGQLKGKLSLQLFNGLNMQPVSLLVDANDAQQDFDVAASTNKAVFFKLAVPSDIDALTYRLTADAGQFSDGEENTLPVLPNRMLVTESLPMMVRSGQSQTFTFDKLINTKSTTLKNKTLTLEYTQNPAWYAVQALPYMMEFPYECSEQVFNRYFANNLGASLINKMPLIKQVFDQWKASNSAELSSNLEKNTELKATLLEETPWLRDAVNESEQKKRIALLFDLNKMQNELQMNLEKLQKRQLPDGGFPWFGGDRSDDYITRYVLAGMGQLYHLGIVDTQNKILKDIADKAMAYLDNQLIGAALRAKAHNAYENRALWPVEIHSYYVQSYFTARTMGDDMKPLLANYLKLATGQWKTKSVYEQALIALTMQRNNLSDVAKAITRSLNETAQHTDDLGMYWGKNQLGYYWYESPIETQSLMIELFTEVGGYDKEVEEMKIWLLRSKQTTNWKTTKATAAACYALLLKGDNWLADNGTSTIRMNNKNLEELKPDIKADAGTGYIKTSWNDEAVKPSMGNVSITNSSKTISWGALFCQYLEDIDKITPSNTDIHLERKYFIVKQTGAGEVLAAVDAGHPPKTGDLLKVIVYLQAGRDFEYVQLKDMRPAGTEPVDALSGYKYQDGLFYYQVSKDVATNFFISYLSKGRYVFEYRLRVAQSGNFSTGISTMQCMYAPEFNAHSEGARMMIK